MTILGKKTWQPHQAQVRVAQRRGISAVVWFAMARNGPRRTSDPEQDSTNPTALDVATQNSREGRRQQILPGAPLYFVGLGRHAERGHT